MNLFIRSRHENGHMNSKRKSFWLKQNFMLYRIISCLEGLVPAGTKVQKTSHQLLRQSDKGSISIKFMGGQFQLTKKYENFSEI